MLLRSAQLKEADKHFSRAHKLGKGEGSYYRGLIAMIEGRLPDAEENFKSGRSSGISCSSCHDGSWKNSFAEEKMGSGDRILQTGRLTGTAFSHSPNFTGHCLPPCRRKWKSTHRFTGSLERDPLNHMALFELAKGNYPESEVVQRKLHRILTDDTQYFMDLACYYIDAGLPEDALEVLKIAWPIKEDAMTAYLVHSFSLS